MIRENVVMLAGNEHMSVVATADCALYFFSKHGRRLLPAVILSAQVAHLQVLGAPANALRAHVVVITSDGMLARPHYLHLLGTRFLKGAI